VWFRYNKMSNEPRVEVRSIGPTGQQCGLFATKNFKVGEVIVLNEQPLMIIEEDDSGETELSLVLANLKAAFDGIADTIKKDTIMDLYCPSGDELSKFVLVGTNITFETIDSSARQLYPDLLCDNSNEHKLTKLFYIWKLNSTSYLNNKSALFALHPRTNHSCCPNATFREGTIRAQKNIAKGEEITHSYIGVETMIASTRVRRDLLLRRCFFTCSCSRCCRSVDLSRIMKCPSCAKHALVPGLTEMTKGDDDDKAGSVTDAGMSIAATCALCKESFHSNSLPLQEELDLERQTLQLWTMSQPTQETSMIAQELHKRVVAVLGGAHWTASALTKIRYDTDPMVNGFIILQWGEAHTKWCQAVLSRDMPCLVPQIRFSMGKNCQPLVSKPPNTQQKLFEISGRRYWNDCYFECRQLWGDADHNVQDIDKMLAQSKDRQVRVDMIVCTSKLCRAKTNDSLSTTIAGSSKKACAACGFAHYCDRACQKDDWPAHKEVCKSTRNLKDLEAAMGVLKHVSLY